MHMGFGCEIGNTVINVESNNKYKYACDRLKKKLNADAKTKLKQTEQTQNAKRT